MAKKEYVFVVIAVVFFIINFSGFCKKDSTEYPERIISLSPNITEIIFALGAEERIAGVSDYCNYPPQAKAIPKIGGVLNPNIEKIIALKPDLLILLPGEKSLEDKLKNIINAKFIIVENETIEEVVESIKTIGITLGKEKNAEKIIKQINEKITEVKKKYSNAPKKRVLCVVDKNPDTLQQLYVVSKPTFLDELIAAAGGENVVKKSIARYPVISKEEIISLNPEVILDFSLGSKVTEKDKERNKKVWSVLESVSAVKNNRVYTVDNPRITIPGPDLPESIEILSNYFHNSN